MDSIIRRHARRTNEKLSPKTYGTKLPVSAAKRFEEICEEANLSTAEVVRLLILEEIRRYDSRSEDENKKVNNSYLLLPEENEKEQAVTYKQQVETLVIADTTKSYVRQPKKEKRSSTTKRFTTTRWQVGGELPCPICKVWTSARNFARHRELKHNDISNEEIFKGREDIADKMLNERLQQK